MSSEVAVQSIFRDAITGDPLQLATTRADGVDKLQVDATGIGPVTLDPTNLALDASIQDLITSTDKAIPPTIKTVEKVTYTGTAGLSSAFGAAQILIVATTDCHIKIGAAPTATADDFFLPAKTILHLSVTSTHKISVIQDASGGSLFVSQAV